MRWRACCLGLCLSVLALPVGAATPAQQAAAARAQLEEAAALMVDAHQARARIAALTRAVQAYEAGLSALREGLRQAAERQAYLQEKLHGRREKTEALLTALLTLQPGKSPEAFLHPQGVTGALRAGIMISDVSDQLAQEAAQLRQDLEDVEHLTVLQREAEQVLETGLLEVQDARLALHQAVAQRTDLPFRFIADPLKLGLLQASADTLDSFAANIRQFATDDLGWRPSDLEARIGALPLPVQGQILTSDARDGASAPRQGLTLRTPPGAVVVNPAKATLRFVGPLLDLGQVVILEPAADVLIVLAGLDLTYGEAGQIIPEGAPLGLMGGLQADFIEIETSSTGERGSAQPEERLYIEVRRENIPQDPTAWFRIDKDG